MKREELLTSSDAGRDLDVTAGCVRLWERLGVIHAAVKTRSGMRLFTKEEVARVAAQRAAAGLGRKSAE